MIPTVANPNRPFSSLDCGTQDTLTREARTRFNAEPRLTYILLLIISRLTETISPATVLAALRAATVLVAYGVEGVPSVH